MNEFVIPEILAQSAGLATRHYPLVRARTLQACFAERLSRHLGGLQSGARFETRGLLVTGPSGAGKSAELGNLLDRFNVSGTSLPSGGNAKFIRCVLSAKGGWKDLGKQTLRALGYPITEKSRRNQTELWDLVPEQAMLRGCIGIHYDEAQHIMRGRKEEELLAILDAFKTLMKEQKWPLMLILSGVPELRDYVGQESQLARLLADIRFEDVNLAADEQGLVEDFGVLNDIVGSYAISAKLDVADDLRSLDFLRRLATAAAFRWGMVIELVLAALQVATIRGAQTVTREDFERGWSQITGLAELASPFTIAEYQTMYRRDRLFRPSIAD